MIKHRIYILASMALLIIAIAGYESLIVFPQWFLASISIVVFITFLASPILAYFAIRDLFKQVNKSTVFFGVASVVYLIVVVYGVQKIWQQLMGI